MLLWICLVLLFGIVFIEDILFGDNTDGCLVRLLKVGIVALLVALAVGLVIRAKSSPPTASNPPQTDVMILPILIPQPPPPAIP